MKSTIINALELAIERLEINNCEGEEQLFIDTIKDALDQEKEKRERDNVMSVLDVPVAAFSKGLLDKIETHEPYTYMDTYDLKEHLYSIEHITEEFQEKGIALTPDEEQALHVLEEAMEENDCAYFRIVKI